MRSRPVRFRDIRVGVVVDLLLDEEARRVVGLEVVCGDRVRRFLPLGACEVGESLQVTSALVLMGQELDFYRRRGRSLAALRGGPVRRGGAEVGTLADVVFAPEGDVAAVVVETPEGRRELPFDPGVSLGPGALRPAV